MTNQQYDIDANERKLAALWKEFVRKNRARTKRAKAKPPKIASVPEAELLALGGVKDGARIVFGGKTKRDVKLIFTPEKDGSWKVFLSPIELSSDDLRRQLNKSGRNLWNTSTQKPDIAYHAVESLLACWKNFRGLAESEQQKAEVHLAISATLQALEHDSKSRGRKLQLAFRLLTNPAPRFGASESIDSLRDRVHLAAVNLQRPPFKAELYDFYRNPPAYRKKYRLDKSDFARLLKSAGLSWLPKKKWSQAA